MAKQVSVELSSLSQLQRNLKDAQRQRAALQKAHEQNNASHEKAQLATATTLEAMDATIANLAASVESLKTGEAPVAAKAPAKRGAKAEPAASAKRGAKAAATPAKETKAPAKRGAKAEPAAAPAKRGAKAEPVKDTKAPAKAAAKSATKAPAKATTKAPAKAAKAPAKAPSKRRGNGGDIELDM